MDTQKLLQEFREAAKKRKIDPDRGANSFQVALVKADASRAKAVGKATKLTLESQARHPHIGTPEKRVQMQSPQWWSLDCEMWRMGDVEHRPVERAVCDELYWSTLPQARRIEPKYTDLKAA